MNSEDAMKELEQQAIRDQVNDLRSRARHARTIALANGIGSSQRRIANELANELFANADRLEQRGKQD